MFEDQQRLRVVLSAADESRAAFASAQRNMDRLAAGAVAASARFAVAGAAFGSFVAAVNVRQIVDAADEMGKLSQKTGIAVERLSELTFAAELSNVSTEALGKGVRNLAARMAGAAAGAKADAALFASIGIASQDSEGKLRPLEGVLADIADQFAVYSDGAAKSTLASQLFGERTGVALIPLLNGSSRALREAAQEARELGVVFDKGLASNAEAVNDNLTRLQRAADGARIALLRGLLPSVNATLESFVRATRQVGLFQAALVTFGEGIAARLGLDESGQLQSRATAISNAIEATTLQLERYHALANNFRAHGRDEDAAAAQEQADRLRLRYADLQRQAATTSAALKGLADQMAGAAFAAPAEGETGTAEAPLPLAARGRADDRKLRQLTQQRLGALQGALEEELDVLEFAGQQARREYDDQLTDLRSFYAERTRIGAAGTAARKQAIDDEIAVLKLEARDAKEPSTRVDAEGRIADAVARRAKVEREASQSVTVQLQEQARAQKALRDSIEDFEQRALSLQGRDGAAQAIDDARQVVAFSNVLRQSGRDTVRADDLAVLLAQTRAVDEAQRRLARVSQAAALAEEDYMLTAAQAGYAREQVEADVLRIRQQALGQLRELTAAVQALAAVSDDPRLTLYARELQLQLRKAEEAVDPLRQRLEGVADNIGQSVGQNISDAIMNRDWKAAGKRIVGDLGSALAEEAFLQPVRQLATNFLRSGISGAGGVGDMLTNALGRMLGIGKPAGTAIDPAFAALSAAKAAEVSTVTALNAAKAAEATQTTALVTAKTAEIAQTSAVVPIMQLLATAASSAATALAAVAASGGASAGSSVFGFLGNLLPNGGGSGSGGAGFGGDFGFGFPMATGTNYVPYDGFLARLHEGEAVVPKPFNPAATGAGVRSVADVAAEFSIQIINHGQPMRTERQSFDGATLKLWVQNILKEDIGQVGTITQGMAGALGLNAGAMARQ